MASERDKTTSRTAPVAADVRNQPAALSARAEIDAFINPRWFITVRKNERFDIEEVMARWDRSPNLAKNGVSFLVYGLLDVVVDGYFTTIQAFDEYYDEPLFHLDSTRAAARSAALLVVVGTTGATNLPLQVGELAVRADAPLVVINPEPNPFSELIRHVSAGVFLEGRAGEWLPDLVQVLAPLAAAPASRR